MKASNYMNAAALVEFLKLGVLASELEVIANNTKQTAKTQQEREWARKMRTSSTMMNNVIKERLEVLDQKAKDSVERRNKHTKMLMESKDNVRVAPADKSPHITVSSDDLTLIAELALMGCGACPQGKYVKDCPYRDMFHRLGIPIGREDVQDGQCEFMTRDEPKVCMPNGFTDNEARKKFSDEDRELLL